MACDRYFMVYQMLHQPHLKELGVTQNWGDHDNEESYSLDSLRLIEKW